MPKKDITPKAKKVRNSKIAGPVATTQQKTLDVLVPSQLHVADAIPAIAIRAIEEIASVTKEIHRSSDDTIRASGANAAEALKDLGGGMSEPGKLEMGEKIVRVHEHTLNTETKKLEIYVKNGLATLRFFGLILIAAVGGYAYASSQSSNRD